MKFFLVLSAWLAIALAEGENSDHHGLAEVHQNCQKNPETYIDDAVIEKLRKHEKVEIPDNLGKHLICMVKGLNLLKEDGKVNEEGLKSHVQHVVTKDEAVYKITRKCAENYDTVEKTAEYLWKCLQKYHIFEGDHSHAHGSEGGESGDHHHHEHGHRHGHH